MGRLLALLPLIFLAACEEVPPCYELVEPFALTRPTGATELVPGQTVRFEWTPIEAERAVVAFILVDGARTVPVGGGATGLGMHEFSTDSNGQPIPAGVYGIEGLFGGCALSAPPYDGGGLRHVYAQGVTFADASLAITAADTPRDITFSTVSLSTFELELLADDLVLARISVPGELVAMTRRHAFTGMTITGAAIPAGTYSIVGRVHARDGVVYDVPGPQLTWTP